MRNDTKIARPRGRPRAFDEDEALDRIRETFLEKGFSGASLDDLASAAGLNRPSLYAAFGDKESLYLHALRRYGEISLQMLDTVLGAPEPLSARLERIYRTAINLYTAPPVPLGCMIVNTAVVEAPSRPKIAAAGAELIARIEKRLEAAFARAIKDGEIPAGRGSAGRARLAGAVFDTLAVRARFGESPAKLKAYAKSIIPVLCG